MKIHNLGNDYAHQQRLKKEAEAHTPFQPIVEPQLAPIDDVEHQLQTGGQTEMGTDNNEAGSETQVIHQETKKASRKKKKEGADV